MNIDEILKIREDLSKQKDEALIAYENASKQLDVFELIHNKELQKYRIEKNNIERQLKKDKEKLKKDINSKIFDYIEIGMWVCVRTNSGKVWQQVVDKNISKWDSEYNTIRCSRPRKSYIPIKAHRREDKSIVYTLSLFGPGYVERSDDYVVNSVIDVLVPISGGFYESKSLRKGFFNVS